MPNLVVGRVKPGVDECWHEMLSVAHAYNKLGPALIMRDPNAVPACTYYIREQAVVPGLAPAQPFTCTSTQQDWFDRAHQRTKRFWVLNRPSFTFGHSHYSPGCASGSQRHSLRPSRFREPPPLQVPRLTSLLFAKQHQHSGVYVQGDRREQHSSSISTENVDYEQGCGSLPRGDDAPHGGVQHPVDQVPGMAYTSAPRQDKKVQLPSDLLTSSLRIQDNQCVRNCDDPDPKKRANFEQPVIQTAQMFVGESGCWLVVGLMSLWKKYISKSEGSETTTTGYQPVHASEADADADADARSVHSNTALIPNGNGKDDGDLASQETLQGLRVLLLSLPAICDILGTTLMNAGLLLVAASIYQMTRGALVLFVGLMSVLFLKRKLPLFKWVSLVGVVLGVAVVGLAGAIWPDQKSKEDAVQAAEVGADALLAIVGVLMIAGAQIFTATQFVLEEWLLERSTIDPIRVVGWEGVFGFTVTVLGMIVLHFAIGRTEAGQYGPFDMVEGWKQWTSNPRVLISSVLIMISIG